MSAVHSDTGGEFDDETTDPGADSDERTLVDEEAPKLVVPWDQLSPDALRGVIEEYVTREGTEYGEHDVPLETKVAAVKRQLDSGEVLVVFDAATNTANLITRQQLAAEGLED
ncbi:MAG: YheU family protein [Polyangiales bacterium]